MPEETAATIVDGWLHTGDLVTVDVERHLHLRRPQEGGAAAPRREPVAGRGRGRDRCRTRTCSSAPSSAFRRSCPRRRSRRSSSRRPARRSTSSPCASGRRSPARARSRCRDTGSSRSTRLPADTDCPRRREHRAAGPATSAGGVRRRGRTGATALRRSARIVLGESRLEVVRDLEAATAGRAPGQQRSTTTTTIVRLTLNW